jgi:hypothetical protein
MTPPTGELSLLLWNTAVLVGSSATFQAACGISTGTAAEKLTAAMARVYWPGHVWPKDVTIPRPLAAIQLPEGATFEAPDSGGGQYMPRFPLDVMLERTAPHGVTAQERTVQFFNFFGGVLGDMLTLAKSQVPDEETAPGLRTLILGNHYLYVTSITAGRVARSAPTEDEDVDQVVLSVRVW